MQWSCAFKEDQTAYSFRVKKHHLNFLQKQNRSQHSSQSNILHEGHSVKPDSFTEHFPAAVWQWQHKNTIHNSVSINNK